MGFSLKKAFTSVFSYDTTVRAGVISAAAVLALGAPLALRIGDTPSDHVADPVAATAQMKVLRSELSGLKTKEVALRTELQSKALTGENVAQADVQQISNAHIAFMKSVLFSRDISETNYASLRNEYIANFGGTYRYSYTYKDGAGTERAAAHSMQGMEDIASFKDCQNEFMTPANLSKPDKMMQDIGGCVSSANGANVWQGFALAGIFGLALIAGFNTRTLRTYGQEVKQNIERKEREAAAAAAEKAKNALKL